LLINGDARRLPLAGGSVALVCTSPTYNAASTESAKSHPNSSRGRHWRNRGYDGDPDDLPEWEYQQGQIRALGEMARVLVPGGSLCYVHKPRLDGGREIDPHAWLLHPAIERAGLVLRQTIIIDRGVTHNHNNTYFWPVYECLYWLTKGVTHRDLGPWASWGSIWRIPRESRPAFDHPAPFHPEIPRRCALALSAPGDVVLDPFSGTGTTAWVARLLGRRAIGIDRSRMYLLKSRRRLEGHAIPAPPLDAGTMPLFGMNKP
jgi:DNA modification methylase